MLLLGSQMTQILRFFLARNMRIARDRAWDQTVASRGKGPDFWCPYVEEWEHPPVVQRSELVKRWFGGWFGLFVIKRGMFGFLLSQLYRVTHRGDSHPDTLQFLPIHRNSHFGVV